MATTHALPGAQQVRWFGSRRVRWAFALLALVLAGYLASLIVRRGPTSPVGDGWFGAAFEAVASGCCFVRAFARRRDRGLSLLLGSALLMWTLGDVVLTMETAFGTPSTPSLADLPYLCFYPLMYCALFVLVRREARLVLPGSWLDGAVAGLGAAAVCATFLFSSLQRTLGEEPLAMATSLAYPIGDLVLLAFAVGGSAVMSGSATLLWRCLAVASAVNALGDTFNLLDAAQPSVVGSIIDAMAWPTSLLLIAFAAWVRSGPRDLTRPLRPPGFVLPALGAAAGIAVLFAAALRDVGWAALSLGTATLLMAGIRFALSVRGMSNLTEIRRRQALTDELTSLGNRRLLTTILDAFFAEQADIDSPRRRLAFLYVDLNRFKEINDSFGHAAGDALLRQIGPRLESALRSTDTLVRLGGDELGIVLMDSDAHDAATVAERVLGSLARAFVVGNISVTVSASIGVATAPADAQDLEGLLRCADVAMYRAKVSHAGIAYYEPELDDEGNRLRLAHELRHALDHKELALHFQPQVNLRTGDVDAVEALLRWDHPRLGDVPPLQFLPIAEELGLMSRLTALVLDLAFEQCAAWHAEGSPLSVSVNVSATNLLEPGFVACVRESLQRHALDPAACVLEITETTIIEDFQECRRVIDELRQIGVAISIDDFGAGFTSLAYLGSLAVNEVKLDRAFVSGLTETSRVRDRDLVRATIELGHTLGLRVVAEGIEDAGSLEMLRSMGCDVAQGFYMGEPAPASALMLASGDTSLAS